MKTEENQMSYLAHFVIRSKQLPTLLEFIKLQCNEFEFCTSTNEELVTFEYADNMAEAGALIIVLRNLKLIDVTYDVSECGKLILCRYIDIVNQNK
tara:strand:+ start:191 stop:478 length:288 start_codon:yes stop_codon:yes gene_type:complete